MCHVVPTEIDDVLFGYFGAGIFQGNEGARRLAPLVIRPGHHGGFQHVRMRVERIFYLDGGDVFTSGDDDVLGPVLELGVTVRMHYTEVTGVKPAAGKGLLGRTGIF